jgi:phage/plasmid-associated DNA primase
MRKFADHEKDYKLLDTLKAESPHILAWMVAGCMEWKRLGLRDVPAIVVRQTAEYQVEQDIIGQWLSECTKVDRTAEIDGVDLYASYTQWAQDNGLKPYTKIKIGRILPERGFTKRHSNGKTLWEGISLNSNRHGGFSHGY